MSSQEIANLKEQVAQLREQLVEAEGLLQEMGNKNSTKGAGLIRLDQAHFHHRCAPEDFNPEVLKQHGWEEALTNLIAPSPYLSVLKATYPANGRVELLVLYPSSCATPIHVNVSDCAEVSSL